MTKDPLSGIVETRLGGWAGFRAAWIARAGRRLIKRGRLGEAETVLARGLERWPRSAVLLGQHAFAAHAAGRYGEAVPRWQALLAEAPLSAFGLAALAANQRELHRLDEAKATIIAAQALHPDDVYVIGEAARIATVRHEHVEALPLWQRIVDIRDAPPEWRQARDWNLIMLGRLDEADVAISQARELAPWFRGHMGNEGSLRMAQGRWSAAIEVLREFRARFPDDLAGKELMGLALHGAAEEEADRGAAAARPPVHIDQVEDEATRALLLRFESLGADCEFGLVQRRYGAEPLGLLRWNWVSLAKLLEALAARFDGLGSEAQTELGTFELGEYRVRDRRWGLSMHTMVFRHQVEPEILLPKLKARLRFLRDKLVEDLSAAQKVFVYKGPALDLAAMRQLHRVLRDYGPVRLLCIVAADKVPEGVPPGRPGEVIGLEEGFHVGYVTRYGNDGDVWNIAYEDWIAICLQADGASAT